MSRFAAIDLSQYPPGDYLEVLDFEAYLARDQADFLARWTARRVLDPTLPALDLASLQLESNPVNMALQTGASRYMLALGRTNDRVRSVMLASARGGSLDAIGITYYRTPRLLIAAADPSAGTAAVYEDDDTYRQRLALSPESWSTAGPEGAYLFYGLSADGDVLDIAAYSEEDGLGPIAPEIRIPILSRSSDDGTAPDSLVAAVKAALDPKALRPLGDLVTVSSATPMSWDVDITLRHAPGASGDLLRQAALPRVTEYASGYRRWIGDGLTGPVWLIGRRFRVSTLAAAAYVDGVEEVIVNGPTADVNAPDPDAAPNTPAAYAHLFAAPRVGTITVRTEAMEDGWL